VENTAAVAASGTIARDNREAFKTHVGETLHRLSTELMTQMSLQTSSGDARDRANIDVLQRRIAFLGQLIAGLALVDAEVLSMRGATYGSRVLVEDDDTKQRMEYTLMVGDLVDIDAGQVSLASPIGQALLGAQSGDIVSFATPQRMLRLRVLNVLPIIQAIAWRKAA
jgi:transcription elongation factor GreA